MPETILITGGAGFIGRRVCARLLAAGHRVRVLDSLIEQVHGDGTPDMPGVNLCRADVRDHAAVYAAVQGVDSVIHLAAEVGVGQSMYAVERYVSVNEVGTAVLFEALIKHPVRRVVTASSMSIYGEGLYRDAEGALVETAERGSRLAGQGWDPVDAHGRPLTPVATPEWKRPSLASVYALGKYAQERLTLTLTAAYGMEGRVSAPVQRLRPRPGALQSLYRRAGHLRFAPPQRPTPDDLRGWRATPRFRERGGCSSRVRSRAVHARCRRRRVQHRLGATSARSPRSRTI